MKEPTLNFMELSVLLEELLSPRVGNQFQLRETAYKKYHTVGKLWCRRLGGPSGASLSCEVFKWLFGAYYDLHTSGCWAPILTCTPVAVGPPIMTCTPVAVERLYDLLTKQFQLNTKWNARK